MASPSRMVGLDGSSWLSLTSPAVKKWTWRKEIASERLPDFLQNKSAPIKNEWNGSFPENDNLEEVEVEENTEKMRKKALFSSTRPNKRNVFSIFWIYSNKKNSS